MVWPMSHQKSVNMRKERVPVKFDLLVGEKKSRENRAKKGYIPVLVGEAKEMQKFLVSVEVFKQPIFVDLLEIAAQEFGYKQKGILRIPCDIVSFQQVIEVISKAM